MTNQSCIDARHACTSRPRRPLRSSSIVSAATITRLRRAFIEPHPACIARLQRTAVTDIATAIEIEIEIEIEIGAVVTAMTATSGASTGIITNIGMRVS